MSIATTHQQQLEAYNQGWNRARHPHDTQFFVTVPKNPVLADEYYQGWDDGRRSRIASRKVS